MTTGLRTHRGLVLGALVAAVAGFLVSVTVGPGWSERSKNAARSAGSGDGPAGVVRGPAGQSGGGDAATGADGAVEPPPRPIPERLPDFALATPEGPLRSLASFTQPSLVVNFWATWCAPCRREIPLLKQIRAERGANGVEIVGIAVDFRDDVLKYAHAVSIDYPLLIGEQDGLEAARAFGMDVVFPFTAFADRRRRIVALKVGELHADEAEFILDMVEAVNAGRLELAQAQTAIAGKLQILAAGRAEKRATAPTPPAT